MHPKHQASPFEEKSDRPTKGWVWASTIKAVQRYIGSSNKLAHMLAASGMIDGVTTSAFAKCATACDLAESRDYQLIQSAGGVMRVWFRPPDAGRPSAALLERMQSFIRIWPLVVARYAPGTELINAVVPVQHGLAPALAEADARIGKHRILRSPHLPSGGPLTPLAPRTGRPAVYASSTGDELLDLETARKADQSEAVRNSLVNSLFVDRIGRTGRIWNFPNDVAEVATGDNRMVAVIYADANGLGARLKKLAEQQSDRPDTEVASAFKDFSDSTARITRQSVIAALEPLIEQIPSDHTVDGSLSATAPIQLRARFRPILCGGDDFIALVPAEASVGAAIRFLLSMERLSKGAMTACAGIALVKVNHPFFDAQALAHRLCSRAKQLSQRTCSALCFERVTDSVTSIGTADCLHFGPYVLGDLIPSGSPRPTVSTFARVLELVESIPRSQARDLSTSLLQGKHIGLAAFERLGKLLKDRKQIQIWESLQAGLKELHGHRRHHRDLSPLFDPSGSGPYGGRTAWHDVLDLMAVGITGASLHAALNTVHSTNEAQ